MNWQICGERKTKGAKQEKRGNVQLHSAFETKNITPLVFVWNTDWDLVFKKLFVKCHIVNNSHPHDPAEMRIALNFLVITDGEG